MAVQNRIKRIEARLPRAVTQQGVVVEEASTSFFQLVTVSSKDGRFSESDLGDLAARREAGHGPTACSNRMTARSCVPRR